MVTALAISSSAFAADILPASTPQPVPQSTNGWSFSFSPYFWAAGLDGKTQVFGLPTVDVSENFSDILSDLDFAFMAAGDARYDRYSVFTDISYARVTTDSATPRGVIADEVSLKSVTFTAMVGGAYTLYEDQQTRFDILGGARFWHVETRIGLSGGLIGNLSQSDDANWVDGLIGFKGSHSFTDRVFVTGWAMIGGGGADLDWDALAAIGYKINEKVSAVAGYRAQGVDYNHDGFTYDVIQHGPILGVHIRF
ncbi:hypothetical protein FZ934_24420 (plasmid) [Rhizobium grahamii]|uniref:Outer membrane protein beta-barrel domain-containing protein n=1 Tax=Rhizobium grahamii TaxID=1120045 RepID=A0A5Q0CFJ8_9HYPH|nr:hypothetical protein FZ934_24420 [Rhizobium grahamii]QRM53026.1 hypothetical protein F3Y33_21225 [Rhizobium sp. BG6]